MQDPYLPEGWTQDKIDDRLEMMANGQLPTPNQVYGEEGAKSDVQPVVIPPAKLWEITDKIVDCLKKAKKIDWRKVDEDILSEEWFVWLNEKLNDIKAV